MTEPAQILTTFVAGLADCIGESGLGITQCCYWHKQEGTLHLEMLDLDLDRPGGLFWHMINLVDSAVTDYFVAAVDMTAAPGQGLEFDDFLLILEFDRRRPLPYLTSQWRYGVLNYRPAPGKVVRPVDWSNAAWTHLGPRYMQRFGPPYRVIVKRADSLEAGNAK